MFRNRSLIFGSASLVALLLGASVAFADTAREADLLGTWQFHSDQGEMRFVFEAGGNGSVNGMPFQWTLLGDELVLTMQGNSATYQVSIAPDEMSLTGGDLETEVRLIRSAGAVGPDTRIHGKWQASNGAIIEFHPDGTGSNPKGGFRYTASNGNLMFDDGTATLVFNYEIQGEDLFITSRGERAAFVRAKPGATVRESAGQPSAARSVMVNRRSLTADEIHALEAQFHVRILDGKYWYDSACGAWGLDGGPCMGFLPPNLQVGSPLPADASGGGTGVFVNGRELHPMDVAALQRITVVQPGRYWVDAYGNCGYEGNPQPLVNLVQLANAARAASGGAYHSRSDITGIGSGGDGRTSYVMGKDWSVVIGE